MGARPGRTRNARPDLYVVARFLDALGGPTAPLSRSRLQVAVGVNYDLFRTYLGLLESKGLVRWEPGPDGKDGARLTHAGIQAQAQLCGWIRSVLGDGRF